MTHEFKEILEAAFTNKHLKHTLATVVALDGSSYRKPGVRMLISENGIMTGAVSGGCVEKEVLHQAGSVFRTQVPKVISYDGNYRLGCNGVLYILIEPFEVSDGDYLLIQEELKARRSFSMTSYFEKEEEENRYFGSIFRLKSSETIFFRQDFALNENIAQFRQNFSAISQLVIIGTEHDAVSLSNAAVQLGWEVSIIGSPRDPKSKANFPGVTEIFHLDPEAIGSLAFDQHTAIVLMNHNYARDLHFLLELDKTAAFYIGVLGSFKRKEKLLNDLLEKDIGLDTDFIDRIFSPAGINIGAVTPQEIAISILGEIIAIKKDREIPSLRNWVGGETK